MCLSVCVLGRANVRQGDGDVISVIKCADVPVISDTPGSLREGRGKKR